MAASKRVDYLNDPDLRPGERVLYQKFYEKSGLQPNPTHSDALSAKAFTVWRADSARVSDDDLAAMATAFPEKALQAFEAREAARRPPPEAPTPEPPRTKAEKVEAQSRRPVEEWSFKSGETTDQWAERCPELITKKVPMIWLMQLVEQIKDLDKFTEEMNARNAERNNQIAALTENLETAAKSIGRLRSEVEDQQSAVNLLLSQRAEELAVQS